MNVVWFLWFLDAASVASNTWLVKAIHRFNEPPPGVGWGRM